MADDSESESSQALSMEVTKLFFMSLGLCYFLLLVSIDLWTSLRSKPHTRWIPGKALILSALTIQVLSYLDYKNIGISDNPDADQYAKLLGNQSVIDSGRLVICVFIGYMLPGMASPGAVDQYSDIAALAMSLFTAITSELYYVHKVRAVIKEVYDYKHEILLSADRRRFELWFVVSSLVVLVCTAMLILFLIVAILAGKTVRCMLVKRIPPVLERLSLNESVDKDKSVGQDKTLASWFLCRVGQPQYVIARSVLSSSTGLVVSVCIVFLVIKGRVLNSGNIIHHDDGWDWMRHITFVLQCAFVLLGWAVILLRWISAVFYFPSFSWGSVWQRCSVEDFWTCSLLEIIHMYDIQQWRLQQLPNDEGEYMAIIFAFGAKLYNLLYLVLGLPKFLVIFSKCCCFISEIIFFVFKLIRKREPDRINYPKYEEALKPLCMPGEDPKSLWLANEKAFLQAKDRLNAGLKADLESQDLSTLLTTHFHDNTPRFVDQLQHLQLAKDYFPALIENCWKITAVSLIKIITKVSSSHKESCVKAYKQAWDLMTFLESSSFEQTNTINVVELFDVEFDPISMAADKEIKMLDCSEPPASDTTTSKEEEEGARRSIQKLLREAEQKLQAQKILPIEQVPQNEGPPEDGKVPDDKLPPQELLDSKDWNVIAPSYNMYIVCKQILNSTDLSGSALVHKLQDLLGDVIGDCLVKLQKTLETNCGAWMIELEEEKIWDTIYFAGKTRALLSKSSTSV